MSFKIPSILKPYATRIYTRRSKLSINEAEEWFIFEDKNVYTAKKSKLKYLVNELNKMIKYMDEMNFNSRGEMCRMYRIKIVLERKIKQLASKTIYNFIINSRIF